AQKRKSDASPAAASTRGGVLAVVLSALSTGWPEEIQEEVAEQGLSEATCEVPIEEIGPALKTGKLQFPWKQIRAWITPSITSKRPTAYGETGLDLPLKVLAPLYLEQCRNALSPKRISVDAEIPDVFSPPGKQAAPPPPTPAAPREAVAAKPAAAAPKTAS